MEKKDIPVVIVEDSLQISNLLSAILEGSEGFSLLGCFGRAEEALEKIPSLLPNVVLVDIHLPGISGIELISRLKPLMPATQFMIFTVLEDSEIIFQALRAGATGYLVKSTPPVKILEAIFDIAHGGSPMSGPVARTIISKFQPQHNPFLDLLTEREKEILFLMAKGFRYKEIADRLYVSIETVRTHIRNIYEKLEVQSRTEALNKAFNK